MGWGSGGEIFDVAAEDVVELVNADKLEEEDGVRILKGLILVLQDGDWDTEEESLGRFRDDPVVVKAFAAVGIDLNLENED